MHNVTATIEKTTKKQDVTKKSTVPRVVRLSGPFSLDYRLRKGGVLEVCLPSPSGWHASPLNGMAAQLLAPSELRMLADLRENPTVEETHVETTEVPGEDVVVLRMDRATARVVQALVGMNSGGNANARRAGGVFTALSRVGIDSPDYPVIIGDVMGARSPYRTDA